MRQVFLLVAACLCGCQSKDHKIANLMEANKKGLDILERAFRTHGSLTADSLVAKISVTNSKFVHQGQSLAALPPFESHSWDWTFDIDRINGREVITSRQVGGGYIFNEMWVADRDDSLYYNLNSGLYSPDDASILAGFNLFPHTYLLAALGNRSSVHYFGMAILDGKNNYVIDGVNGSSVMRLWINDQNFLLSRAEFLATSYPYGDGLREYDFDDYQHIGHIQLPASVSYTLQSTVFGSVNNIYNVREMDSSDLNEPDTRNFKPADYSYRKNVSVNRLADGIYVIENITGSTDNWSYNILFAEFEDHILVTEAPLNNAISELVMRLIKETISHKPIRYLVQSHHHNDHLGGIRAYVAEGTKIITGDGNIELIKRITSAPFNLTPDRLAKQPIEPVFESLISKKLSLHDTKGDAVIYDIGATVHAEQMLVTYFPKYRILFQSDMINYGEWPLDTDLTRTLVSKIKALDLSPKMIVGIHGRIIEGKALEQLLNDR